MTDQELLKWYSKGFDDELKGNTSTVPKEAVRAYSLGALHALVGDDVRAVDYMSDEEILEEIKESVKPIHKFNGGIGATLCNKCNRIISTGLTEDLYCEDCGGKSSHKYILTRAGDGKVIKGRSILYIEWDESGRFKEKHESPGIGRSLTVDFNGGNFKWMTTQIKEILEESDNLIIFVTKNSQYKLEKLG